MEESEIKATVKERFTDYLNVHAQRKTPERYAILDTIYSMDGHFDIDQLYDVMLNEEKFRVSRATLYNTLDLLLDARLILRHQFGHAAQYERLYGCEPHHHMVCTVCGTVTEFKSAELRETVGKLKLKRFTPSHYSLYVYGICSKCAQQLKRKQKKLKTKTNKDKQ